MSALRQNKHSVCKVIYRETGRILCYLSARDIEQGADVSYDLAGYEVVSL